MSVHKIKVGLASYGLSGQVFHAPFIDLHPNLELTTICERTKTLSSTRYSYCNIVTSFEDLITDKSLDLIVINTPSYLHYDMAKEALSNNKHVVLDKPFGSTAKEAQELINLAEQKNLTLAIYQNRRLESGFKTVNSLVKENKLTELTYFKSHLNRNKPTIGQKEWKENSKYTASGIFYDLAPHLIDQAVTLFGSPQKINYKTERQRPKTTVDDYFLITLSYPNDLKVELEAGMYIKDKEEPKYILKGTQGIYTKDKEDHQEWLLKQGIFPSSFDPDRGRITAKNGFITPIKNVKGSYNDFYINLYDHLTNKTELLIKPYEALEVMKIMDFCLSTKD